MVAADADLLFPRCLQTTRIPAGILPCFSFGEPEGSVAGEDDGDGADNSPENFGLLLCLLETLMYRGLISFKYFCITSLENLLDESLGNESSEICFLKLFSLVNIGTFAASLSLNLTVKSLLSCFLFFGVSTKTPFNSASPVFPASCSAIDFDFLNMRTLKLGADLRGEMGD